MSSYINHAIEYGKEIFNNQVAATIGEYYEGAYEVVSDKIYHSYSPWVFAEQATRLAEQGGAKPIESSTIVDLSQFLYQKHWADYFPLLSTVRRAVHVVNDPDLIKQGLKYGRSSEMYAIYPTIIDRLSDPHNMLLCPTVEHTKLRAPFEKLFSERSLRAESLKKLAYISLLFSDVSGVRSVRENLDALVKQPGRLSSEEAESSLEILDIASKHTTSTTLGFVRRLLKIHPQWADRIIEDWENRFGNIEELFSIPWEKQKLNQTTEVEGLDWSLEEKLIVFVEGGEWKGRYVEPSVSLQAFVMEACRLYPVVPQVIRIAKQNFQLGETAIQTGDVVMFNVLGYQRDANRWENPTTFCPERFMGKDEKPNLTKGPLLNFSHGKEQCIGKNLAKYTLLFCATQSAVDLALYNKEKEKFVAQERAIGKNSHSLDTWPEAAFRGGYYRHMSSEGQTPSYRVTPPFLSYVN